VTGLFGKVLAQKGEASLQLYRKLLFLGKITLAKG